MFNLSGLQWAKVFSWIFIAGIAVIMVVVSITGRKKGRKSTIKPMSIQYLPDGERGLRELERDLQFERDIREQK
jgi:hypothetical protein